MEFGEYGNPEFDAMRKIDPEIGIIFKEAESIRTEGITSWGADRLVRLGRKVGEDPLASDFYRVLSAREDCEGSLIHPLFDYTARSTINRRRGRNH